MNEKNNLFTDPDYEQIRNELKQRVLKWMAKANEPEPKIIKATE